MALEESKKEGPGSAKLAKKKKEVNCIQKTATNYFNESTNCHAAGWPTLVLESY